MEVIKFRFRLNEAKRLTLHSGQGDKRVIVAGTEDG
jgi:hypothetical protein